MEGVGGRNFCPPASVPVPFEQRKSGRGFGGIPLFLCSIKMRLSPATLLFKARHHRKILFIRRKEIRRAQNEKSKEYFSVVWRGGASGGGLASLVWFRSAVFDKIGSSQTVKTHQNLTFRKLTDFWLAAQSAVH